MSDSVAIAAGWSFETGVRTLWQEARGEPLVGQQAVAHVLVNRLNDGRWGHTLAAVCLYPLQFSGWNIHDPNRMAAAALPDDDPMLSTLRGILSSAFSETDPTGGAKFYYAASIHEPDWAKAMISCGQFGHQFFFRERT